MSIMDKDHDTIHERFARRPPCMLSSKKIGQDLSDGGFVWFIYNYTKPIQKQRKIAMTLSYEISLYCKVLVLHRKPDFKTCQKSTYL